MGTPLKDLFNVKELREAQEFLKEKKSLILFAFEFHNNFINLFEMLGLRWKEGKKIEKIDFSKIMYFDTLKNARHYCEIRIKKKITEMSLIDF